MKVKFPKNCMKKLGYKIREDEEDCILYEKLL